MSEELLLYDGECPICAAGARAMRTPGIRLVPLESGGTAVRLVGADGTVRAGVEALRRLFSMRVWTRPLAWAAAMPGARFLYSLIARNRRAIAPTPRNVRVPRNRFGESPGWMAAFTAIGFIAALGLAFGYGASAGPILGADRTSAALLMAASVATGWAISLPALLWTRELPPFDLARHAAFVAASGALLLAPISIVNPFALSAVANAVVGACAAIFVLGCMTWRLKLYGLPLWRIAAWFVLLGAGALATWSSGA